MRKGKGSRGGCDKKGSTAPTERKVTSVFVSRLPLDATEQSIADYFKKCGILYEDPHTGLPRVKLYRDEEGKFKGEALVIYLKEESVNLAVQLLDESAFDGKATGPFIRVERANFKDYKCNLIKEENLSESKIVPNVSDLTHCSRPDLSAPSLSSESAEEKLLKKRKIEKLKQ